MKVITIILALAACTDVEPTGTITDECGELPARPGYAVFYYEDDAGARAILRRAEFDALDAWGDDIKLWSACAVRVKETP